MGGKSGKRIFIIIGLLFAVGAVFLFAPGLPKKLIWTIRARQAEQTLREQTDQLAQFIADGDMGKCMEMTAPSETSGAAKLGTKVRWGLITAYIRLNSLTMADYRVTDVWIGPEVRHANLTLELHLGDEWKPQDPIKWVRVDDQWYVSLK